MKKIFYSLGAGILILVVISLLSGSAYIKDHPAMGTYDLYPELYRNSSHHSDDFIALFSNNFAGMNFANYMRHGHHTFHDHTWSIKGHTITIKCWDNYDNNGYVLREKIKGTISEDWKKITIGEDIFYRVTNKRLGPGKVEF